MVKDAKNRIFPVLLVVLMTGLLTSIVISCAGIRVAGRCEKYIDDYEEYYLYRKEYNPLISFAIGAVSKGYKVWFLPGQKGRLLNKIKEDINTELTDIVMSNSNILKDYEVSDDYRKIDVYFYKDARSPVALVSDLEAIAIRLELYHEFIHGYGNTGSGSIVNAVELDE